MFYRKTKLEKKALFATPFFLIGFFDWNYTFLRRLNTFAETVISFNLFAP